MTLGRVVTFLVLGGVFLLPQTARAQSECPSFPKVAFWGSLTHESVRRHVENKLSGNWTAYLNQLLRQQKTLSKIYNRGSGAIVKRQGRKIKLSGALLSKYIKYNKARISVVQCLAELEDATGFANFSTAAGTPDKMPLNKASRSSAPAKSIIRRTYLKIPANILAKLRKIAVRKSLKETRKVTVSEVVVEILAKELKNRGR